MPGIEFSYSFVIHKIRRSAGRADIANFGSFFKQLVNCAACCQKHKYLAVLSEYGAKCSYAIGGAC